MGKTRETCLTALKTVIEKPTNCDKLENALFELATTRDEYIRYVYDAIYTLKYSKNRNKDLYDLIYGKKCGWTRDTYNKVKEQLDLDDYFASNKLEIEEGVTECKCGSKRTISCQRQTRSADEGMTTFSQCVECGNRWRNS